VTPPAPTGVAASVALGDLLSGPRTPARVRGISGPACYLDADGIIVVVENADGAGLPNAVRVAHPARPPLQLGTDDQVVLGRGALTVGGRELPVHRWWDPYVRVGSSRLDAAGVAVATATLRSAATSTEPVAFAPPDCSALAQALRTRDDAAVAAAATALLGRGPGLTPAGDDVLAGLLAALRVLGPSLSSEVAGRVAATADALATAVTGPAHERTTALSAQLLAHADRGAVALPVADVLRAVAGRGALVASAARLARVGHTSGRDLLTGIALAVGIMLPESRGARVCLT
jgi:Protein of unknown function (DUF2877)